MGGSNIFKFSIRSLTCISFTLVLYKEFSCIAILMTPYSIYRLLSTDYYPAILGLNFLLSSPSFTPSFTFSSLKFSISPSLYLYK